MNMGMPGYGLPQSGYNGLQSGNYNNTRGGGFNNTQNAGNAWAQQYPTPQQNNVSSPGDPNMQPSMFSGNSGFLQSGAPPGGLASPYGSPSQYDIGSQATPSSPPPSGAGASVGSSDGNGYSATSSSPASSSAFSDSSTSSDSLAENRQSGTFNPLSLIAAGAGVGGLIGAGAGFIKVEKNKAAFKTKANKHYDSKIEKKIKKSKTRDVVSQEDLKRVMAKDPVSGEVKKGASGNYEIEEAALDALLRTHSKIRPRIPAGAKPELLMAKGSTPKGVIWMHEGKEVASLATKEEVVNVIESDLKRGHTVGAAITGCVTGLIIAMAAACMLNSARRKHSSA